MGISKANKICVPLFLPLVSKRNFTQKKVYFSPKNDGSGLYRITQKFFPDRLAYQRNIDYATVIFRAYCFLKRIALKRSSVVFTFCPSQKSDFFQVFFRHSNYSSNSGFLLT